MLKQTIFIPFMRKWRRQTLYILASFTLGVVLTLSIRTMDSNDCHNRDQHTIHHTIDGLNNLPERKRHHKTKASEFDLVILVISSPRNGDRRQMIRETWLQLQEKLYDLEFFNFRITHHFVIGSSQLSTDTILHLSTEQSVNNDLLFVDIHDEYQSLSKKVLKSFEWLYRHNIANNVKYDYVLKCDDDSFVRLDQLALELHKLAVNDLANVERKELYWGYFNGRARVKTQGKWMEDEWFLCDYYLPYALGGGYVLSRALVDFIGQNAAVLRTYKSEDVSVGVWLAGVANIHRKHDIRFDTEWQSRGCNDEYLITHKHSIDDMRAMFKHITATGRLCAKEFLVRRHYVYNWQVAPSKCCEVVN